jgi:hypothetical protein
LNEALRRDGAGSGGATNETDAIRVKFSTFKLKDIDDGIALIESEGDLTSDKSESNLMGYSVTSNLQGDQQGEYEIDTKTGMLLKNKVTAKVEGSIQIMGKDVPLTIKTTVKMNGKKIR